MMAYVTGQDGMTYCARHESKTGPILCTMHPATLAEECPFCWFERPENAKHSCSDSSCYCHMVREALRNGDVWVRDAPLRDGRHIGTATRRGR